MRKSSQSTSTGRRKPWQGYSAKHNTWELIIPDAVLHKSEQNKLTPAITHAPTKAGLRDRQTIKPNYKPDYISSN